MKVIIVGGVAGGATAAARIRRLDEKAEIVVYERSGYISYANCGLPYFVGEVIRDREDLTLQSPEGFFIRFRVQVKVHHEVCSIDPASKTIRVKNTKTGQEFTDSYDKLLLSPGAKPVRPNFPGIDAENIFVLRSVEDTFRLKKAVDEAGVKSAVIIGGGFVGVEIAENLRKIGLSVTIVELADQLLTPFDRDMAAFIHAPMREHGIHLALGSAVAGFKESGGKIDVLLQDGDPIHADLAVLAIGVAPETALAAEAGLETGLRGSILVNDKMETSEKDIYAVGDAVQVKHFVTGEDTLIALAGPANKQGRIAADNICGGDSRYTGSQGSSVVKVFDVTAAATGINEKTARRLGLNYDKIVLSPMSHAGYYPGGAVMTMKVLYERGTDRLLGAQIVGFDGVDKRIDVLATAIRAGVKASDLKDLDLAYAPPYSSAKDPVNMAGFMIENINKEYVKQWYLEDVLSICGRDDVTRLDVRTPVEYEAGHIEGFPNLPVDELREHLSELPKDRPVYVICQSGLRSYIATRILKENGFDAYNFTGGFRFYHAVTSDAAIARTASPCGKE
jgi:NADPH-dependent 2,4-dienoyl-CoA reductase/sulfur reductase-like enzyme/rhodanese-related sulfurtransferase